MNEEIVEGARAPIVHALPGRVRLHLPGCSEAEAAAIRAMPGVRFVSVNPVTGNILIRYDPARLDEAAVLRGVDSRTSAARRPIPIPKRDEPWRPQPERRWRPDLPGAFVPALRLLLGATPLGLPLHVIELLWAFSGRSRAASSSAPPQSWLALPSR